MKVFQEESEHLLWVHPAGAFPHEHLWLPLRHDRLQVDCLYTRHVLLCSRSSHRWGLNELLCFVNNLFHREEDVNSGSDLVKLWLDHTSCIARLAHKRWFKASHTLNHNKIKHVMFDVIWYSSPQEHFIIIIAFLYRLHWYVHAQSSKPTE